MTNTNTTTEEQILPLGSDDFASTEPAAEPVKQRRRPGPVPRSASTADAPKEMVSVNNEKLFLVEGNVRLVPIPGEGAAVSSDQRRLVWAQNDDDAVAKYVAYFNEMSTFRGRYIVAGVSVTEAIR